MKVYDTIGSSKVDEDSYSRYFDYMHLLVFITCFLIRRLVSHHFCSHDAGIAFARFNIAYYHYFIVSLAV